MCSACSQQSFHLHCFQQFAASSDAEVPDGGQFCYNCMVLEPWEDDKSTASSTIDSDDVSMGSCPIESTDSRALKLRRSGMDAYSSFKKTCAENAATFQRDPNMKISHLLAFLVGAPSIDRQEARLKAFQDKGWLNKSVSKPYKLMLLAEANRRIGNIISSNKGKWKSTPSQSREPRPGNWAIPKLEAFLKEFPPTDLDKKYIAAKLIVLLDAIEDSKTTQASEKQLMG